MHKLKIIFLPVISLFFSIYLVCLSVPRLITNLQVNFSESVYKKLYSSTKPTNDSILRAIERLNVASELHQNPIFVHHVGHFFHRLIYSGHYEEDEYLAMAYSAAKANQMCLALSPVEPYVWYRLAVSRFIIDETDKRIVNFLKLSIFTSRNEQNLFIRRLIFLSRYVELFNDELIALINDQIRLTWRSHSRRLLEAANDSPVLKALVLDALLPDELVIFNKQFDKFTQ